MKTLTLLEKLIHNGLCKYEGAECLEEVKALIAEHEDYKCALQKHRNVLEGKSLLLKQADAQIENLIAERGRLKEELASLTAHHAVTRE